MMTYRKLRLCINASIAGIILLGLVLISFASFGNWITFEGEEENTNTFEWRYLAEPAKLKEYTEDTYSNSGIARWLRYLNLKYLSEIFIFQDEGYVIPGHGGMLFAFNEQQKQFYQKEPLFTEDELDEWTRVFSERKRWLGLNGIDYYYMSVPNKSTVYADRVPNRIYRAKGPDRFDQLKAKLLKETDVPVIDIRSDLIQAKPENLLYSLGDTHWNLCGAYIGYSALMDRIVQDFPDLHVVDESSLKLRASETRHSELGRVMRVNPLLKDDVLYYLPDYPPNYMKDELPRDYFSYTWPTWEPFQKNFSHVTIAPEVQSPDVMIFHDSFFRAMFFYVSESFGRAAYIWNRNIFPGECPSRIDFQAVERERPRIVIEECVERFLSHGPATNPVDAQERDLSVARMLRFSPATNTSKAIPVEGAWLIHDYAEDKQGGWLAGMGGWEGGTVLMGSGKDYRLLPEQALWEPMALSRFSEAWYAAGRSGTDGQVAVLDDAGNWNERFRLENAYLATAAIHQEQLFVAGESGAVFASKNGRDWKDVSMDAGPYVRKLVSGGGDLLALGDKGLVAFWNGGWNMIPGDGYVNWKDAVFVGGEWILVGERGADMVTAILAKDGYIMDPQVQTTGSGQAIVELDGTLWALVSGSYQTRLLSSPDGRIWTTEKSFPEILGNGLELSGEDLVIYGMQRFKPSEKPELNRDLWTNVWDIGNGFEYLSWFGFFDNSKLPWLWHEDVGWFYSTSTSPDNIWISYPDHGDFYTNQVLYPQFFDKEKSKPHYLKDGEVIPVEP